MSLTKAVIPHLIPEEIPLVQFVKTWHWNGYKEGAMGVHCKTDFRANTALSREDYRSLVNRGAECYGKSKWLIYQSFITTTLALKLNNTSYWDITEDSSIGNDIDTVWQEMLPGVEH